MSPLSSPPIVQAPSRDEVLRRLDAALTRIERALQPASLVPQRQR